MPTRIRLARHGSKRRPYYYIVVADGRAPRDGNFIERIGTYNPNTNPATIDLDFDKALSWLQKGAQPSDTTRAILSYEGVLMKKHLLDGAKKGAFDQETAQTKFDNWKREKLAKIQKKRDSLSKASSDDSKKRFAAEAKINEARSQELAKRNSDLIAEAADARAEARAAAAAVVAAAEVPVVAEVAVEAVAEVAVEEPAVEEKKEETAE